jgi:hypothetical protein
MAAPQLGDDGRRMIVAARFEGGEEQPDGLGAACRASGGSGMSSGRRFHDVDANVGGKGQRA